MKTKQTIIAALVGGLFVSGAAFAKEKWEYHESDWSGTKSYGSVALSEDSVGSWGPWAAFEEPAAGMPTQVLMPGAGAGDPYRVIPKVTATATDDFCRAGEWCGYAAFTKYTWSDYEEFSSETRPHPGRFALTLSPDDPSAVRPGVGSGEGSVSWRLVSLNGTSPTFGDSGGAMPAYFGYYDDGLGRFYAYRDTSSGGVRNGAMAESSDYYYYWYLPTSNPEVAAGAFYRYIETYVSGGEESYGYSDGVATIGVFVAGIATPQAYLDAQRAGNVVATYSGNSANSYWGGSTVPVSMTVNFGNSTWTGSWNGGRDGSVSVVTDPGGNKYWVGQVGFNANGTISGANIASTSVSATDGTIGAGSSVKGTFFGQTAGSIGGVSDIVKTKVVGETAQTASHTAVFLVDKGGKVVEPR